MNSITNTTNSRAIPAKKLFSDELKSEEDYQPCFQSKTWDFYCEQMQKKQIKEHRKNLKQKIENNILLEEDVESEEKRQIVLKRIQKRVRAELKEAMKSFKPKRQTKGNYIIWKGEQEKKEEKKEEKKQPYQKPTIVFQVDERDSEGAFYGGYGMWEFRGLYRFWKQKTSSQRLLSM